MDAGALEAIFRIVDESEAKKPLVATIAAEATFYFDDVSRALATLPSAYERLVDAMGRNATYILVGVDATRPRKFRRQDRDLIAKWVQSAAKHDEYALSVYSGPTLGSYGPWSLELSLEAEQPPRLKRSSRSAPVEVDASYLYFTTPVNLAIPDPSKFRDLVLAVAAMIPFRSGHAGFGLAYNDGDPESDRDKQLAAWNKRYRGLDAGSPDCSAPFATNRIRGVNWLTMLDADFLAKVGGTRVLDDLGSDVKIYSLPHGIAVQAGEVPRLGDVNVLEDMSAYRRVDRALKAIRARDMYPPTEMTEEDAAEWLARFDEA